MKAKLGEKRRLLLGVLFLGVIILVVGIAVSPSVWMRSSNRMPPQPASSQSVQQTGAQGASIYASRCAGCHGPDGRGATGAFPPMKGDPVVADKDPTAHIRTVLFGLRGKVINGTSYTATMPTHAPLLSDEEIAAVINYERTSWGNSSPTVTAKEVADVRRSGH